MEKSAALPDKLTVSLSHKVLEKMLSHAKYISHENRELSLYWSVSHMITSTQTIRLLALKRNLNMDFASIAAALHDVATFFTGEHKDHAAKALQYLDEAIEELNSSRNGKRGITVDEAALLKEIIPMHSDKTDDSGNAYAELLKDADALDRYLHGVATKPHEWPRLSRVLSELNII